jgi:oligopeptidase A
MDKDIFDFTNKNYKKLQQDIENCIQRYYEIFDKVKVKKEPTYQNTIKKLNAIETELSTKVGYLSHLYSIENNEKNTNAYNAIKPELTKLGLYTGQSKEFFENLKEIQKQELNQEQQKVVDNMIDSFKLSGIALNETDRSTFNHISKELSNLSSQFSENLLNSTDDWFLEVTEEDLEGMPESAIQTAKAEAKERELDNYVLTLQMPCYIAVMTHADDRYIREAVYKANSETASPYANAGKYDNSQVILDIVNKKQEKAKLLGFKNYAELSTSKKMAENPETVLNFLEDLLVKSLPSAKKELEELKVFAQQKFGIDEIKPWDLNYLLNKAKEEKYEIDSKEVMEYLPLNSVLSGLFGLLNKLYNIQLIPVQTDNKWNDDVLVFEIFNKDYDFKGTIIMDLYARSKKRGGAWVNDFKSRNKNKDEVQYPIAFLTCNFSKGETSDKTLLNHREVVTLFHEMGHALHHTLTEVNEMDVSGLNGVEWDAVELPSQFHENFCFHKETIKSMSRHYITGESLPDTIIDKLIEGKNFGSALGIIRQIEFSLLDMKIHLSEKLDNETLETIKKSVYEKTSLVEKIETDSFLNGFGHIFAGGYSAGYYSYKWAEVLSADAFESFVKDGNINFEKGQDFYENILSKGGSDKAINLFKNFKGAEPDPTALLRSLGISNSGE